MQQCNDSMWTTNIRRLSFPSYCIDRLNVTSSIHNFVDADMKKHMNDVHCPRYQACYVSISWSLFPSWITIVFFVFFFFHLNHEKIRSALNFQKSSWNFAIVLFLTHGWPKGHWLQNFSRFTLEYMCPVLHFYKNK